MKIMTSNIILESAASQEMFDLSFMQTSDRRTTRIPADSRAENTVGNSVEEPEGPVVLLDRVSISSSAEESYQSYYSSTVTAHTRITSNDAGSTVDREQIHAVEKLITGLIGQVQGLEMNGSIMPSDRSMTAGQPGKTANVPDQWQMSITRTEVYCEEASMMFGARGTVVTEDGRTIDFSLSMEMERSFEWENSRTDRITGWQERGVLTDPLVINLSGRAPELTDMMFSFDLDSDGDNEQISFLKPGSGFLVLDKNNDQTVNNGSELFGPDTGNGFGELAAYDEDHNLWIDENDAVFSQLYVWTKDDQANDVLISLKDAGIGAISLSGTDTAFDMKGAERTLYGKIRRSGVFLFEDGSIGSVQQVDLAAREVQSVDNRAGRPDEAVYAPLPETLDVQSKIMEENQKKILKARLLDVQRFTAPAPEPVNRIKVLLEMVEKLKKEFEASMQKHHPGRRGAGSYPFNQPQASGFIPGPMARINYRI